MPLKEVKFKHNQTILKVFGYGDNKKIKVITMNTLRNAGVEDDGTPNYVRCTVNDEKLSESITRAKSKIFEYAFCNPWDFFITATLNPSKYDRTDLEKYHKDLTQFFRDYGKKHAIKIDFLLIPELHKDGKSWHMHGFLKGIPLEHLHQFQIGDIMGKTLAEKVMNGDAVYNWEAYQKKFGFCDLEPICNPEAVSKYITKYINKDLATSVTELNAHLYYHSRGLKTAVTLKKGTMICDIVPSFVGNYCTVSWLDYDEKTLKYLNDNIIK
ncbi:MAG: hypothetical protein ACI4JG_03095 [Acutalibacteraceae bacterium]